MQLKETEEVTGLRVWDCIEIMLFNYDKREQEVLKIDLKITQVIKYLGVNITKNYRT